MEQYWTPYRVRYWLERYPQLEAAVRYGCAVDAGDTDPGVRLSRPTGGVSQGLATDLLCIKCDLDIAMREALSERERRVLRWRYVEQWTTREIARHLRVSHTTVVRICEKGCSKIASRCGYTK